MMVEDFGNANSVENLHGERAALAVSHAKELVASVLSAEPDDVHFTSGSTEAIQLAVGHAIATHPGPLRVAMSRVEHKAVIDTVLRAERMGFVESSWIDVDDKARLDWSSLERVLSQGVDLVCVMAANNEVGTTYPVQRITSACHAHGAAVLIDATQAVGRMAFEFGDEVPDYVALSGHKVYSPKGIGALLAPQFDRVGPARSWSLRGHKRALASKACAITCRDVFKPWYRGWWSMGTWPIASPITCMSPSRARPTTWCWQDCGAKSPSPQAQHATQERKSRPTCCGRWVCRMRSWKAACGLALAGTTTLMTSKRQPR
jgi:hypothetical protein